MTTCYKLSNSLTPDRLEMLDRFRRIAEEQGVPFLLVGAAVLQLILTGHHNIEERRKTHDLDFGVMLPGWDCYGRLAHALKTSGSFQQDPNKPPHEFRYGAGKFIDVIPFGAISRDNAIAWPPENASVMNITGYEDVFSAAVEIDFGQDIRIKSASLPGIVLLKLFAWNDRPYERPRDLKDIWQVLENYYLAGAVETRLHTEHPDLQLPAENFCNLAGARILGRDLASLCSPPTHAALKELLEREREKGDRSKILVEFEKEVADRGTINEPFEHANVCWEEFVTGCLETAPQG